VSVVAIRTAVSTHRSERAQKRLRQRATVEVAGAASPELLAMKGELQRELETAMATALERLGHRERLVLGFYLVSGMTMADIGRTYGVTQQTVSRWLLKARQAVLADVRRQLGERLNIANPYFSPPPKSGGPRGWWRPGKWGGGSCVKRFRR